MSDFLKSFSPLLKKLKLRKYLLEITLLTVAIFITVISLIVYTKNSQTTNKDLESSEALLSPALNKTTIFIDVSGAVKKPSLYKINSGARIKDAIDMAGGLSGDADVMFFNRNFNLARIVSDQEKIYIPSIVEIDSGFFVQNQQVLDYTLPSEAEAKEGSKAQSLINLNSATVEELDQLPGIGLVIANKIITNRPYSVIDELLTNKVVNKGVFEKIKNLISI